MAEMSPLRRRMIEDMTIRDLSPAAQRSYIHAVAKFPGITADRQSGFAMRTSALSRYISCRTGFRGRRRTRRCARCGCRFPFNCANRPSTISVGCQSS